MKANEKYKILEKYFPEILNGVSELIQKARLSRKFSTFSLNNNELVLLNKAKELSELKILEYWNSQDDEFKLLCSIYFDVASLLIQKYETEEDIFEGIKLISLGYIGEHNHFVKEYFSKVINEIEKLDSPNEWNKRLLTTCFKAIVYLVIKDSWNDIDKSINLINQLRIEQKQFEENYLNEVREESHLYGAAELVSLYHFAKTIDVLGSYLLEGKFEQGSYDIENKIKYHLKVAEEFAFASGNLMLELLYKYFEVFGISLAKNSIWYTLTGINHWVSAFNKFITHKENNAIYELLYPQKNAILNGQLLNPTYRSIVISLPTSSGKTLLAEYKILQALNEFKERGGWVAYIVPTKALVNQIFIRLNQDLANIGLKIDKASGVAEIDGFESYLVENRGDNTNFDVLVTTYEKLHLLVRQGLGSTENRPLVLTIVDEAHNLEEKQRGLNLELLLSTIKNDCREANFVLLTPDIPNAHSIAEWLGGDRSKCINIQYDWWQPNERVVGALRAEGKGKNFEIYLETLNTIKGTFKISEKIPLLKNNSNFKKTEISSSDVKLASYVAYKTLSEKSHIIVLAGKVNETYKIAEKIYENIDKPKDIDNDVLLLKKYVQAELGEDFPLAKYLDKKIAIHSSAIPDDIRQLIEILMTEGKLQVIVATTTIAQGINFPVSAVILSSYNYPFSGSMPTRDFWNLAGRVGRVGQDSIGWIGIACKNQNCIHDVASYVKQASVDLLSQFESAIDKAFKYQNEDFSRWLFVDERWSALLQYISHLRLQIDDLNMFINRLEEKLNGTLGFRQISNEKKQFIISKLKDYVKDLSLEYAQRADSTGFSTITVGQMINRLKEANILPSAWNKEQLFNEQNQTMQKLVGIMLNTYEIRKSLEEIKSGEKGFNQNSISKLIIDWVNGKKISEMARILFPNENISTSIEKVTKAIYRSITNMATWGIAALQKMPTSGINWNDLSDTEKKKMMNLPAYIHYGVNTDEGVLMRKANVPRSIANNLGSIYKEQFGDEIFIKNTSEVTQWLNSLNDKIWQITIPANSNLSGFEYKKIWMKLNNI